MEETKIDFYKLLNIHSNATEQEINANYRKLALKYHPDKNKDGAELFKLIKKAKEILIDPIRRAEYDENIDNFEDQEPTNLEPISDENSSFKFLSNKYRKLLDIWEKIGNLRSVSRHRDIAKFDQLYSMISLELLTEPLISSNRHELIGELEQIKNESSSDFDDKVRDLRNISNFEIEAYLVKTFKNKYLDDMNYRTIFLAFIKVNRYLYLDLNQNIGLCLSDNLKKFILSNYQLIKAKLNQNKFFYTSRIPIFDLNNYNKREDLEELLLNLTDDEDLDSLKLSFLNEFELLEKLCCIIPEFNLSKKDIGKKLKKNNQTNCLTCDAKAYEVCKNCGGVFCIYCLNKILIPNKIEFKSSNVCDFCLITIREDESKKWSRMSTECFKKSPRLTKFFKKGLIYFEISSLLRDRKTVFEEILFDLDDDSNFIKASLLFYELLNENKDKIDQKWIVDLSDLLKEIGMSYFTSESESEALDFLKAAKILFTFENDKTGIQSTVRVINKIEENLKKTFDKMKIQNEINNHIYGNDLESLVMYLNSICKEDIRLAINDYFLQSIPKYMDEPNRKSLYLFSRGFFNLFFDDLKKIDALKDLEQSIKIGWAYHDKLIDHYANIIVRAYKFHMISPIELQNASIYLNELGVRAKENIWSDKIKLKSINLKPIIKYEKNIWENEANPSKNNWTWKKSAIAYIDLISACDSIEQIIFCFICAALSVLKEYREKNLEKAKKYAISMFVFDCLENAILLSYRTLSWDMKAFVFRISFKSMLEVAETTTQIKSIQDVLPMCLFFGAFSPVQFVENVSVSESLLLSLQLKEIRNAFMKELNISNKEIFKREIIDYFHYEAYWKAGHKSITEDHLFETFTKHNTMSSFLVSHDIYFETIQQYIEYPLIKRNKGGWIEAGEQLKIYNGLHQLRGLRINKKTQNITLLTDNNNYFFPLLDYQDVALILSNSGDSSEQFPICYFSLDPIDERFYLHPFQKFRYGPKCLKGSLMLSTLFHTDYLMKQFSIGMEISSKPPFKQREISDYGLFKGFSKELKEAFMSTPELDFKNKRTRTHNCHRFWIQADQMPYNIVEDDEYISYLFGEVKMSIKCRAQILNSQGENKDTIEQEDQDSSEYQFAKNFTKNYDEIAYKHFPEFLRLKELCKLQYIGKFLENYQDFLKQNVFDDLSNDQLKNIKNRIEKQIIDILKTIREKIGNNNDSGIIDQIKSLLQDKQKELLNDDLLTTNDVLNWLDTKNDQGLAKKILPNDDVLNVYVDSAINGPSREAFIQKKNRFENILNEILVFSNEYLIKSIEKWPVDIVEWVPAIFRQFKDENYFVYGGVSLQPKLIKDSSISLPNNSEIFDLKNILKIDENDNNNGLKNSFKNQNPSELSHKDNFKSLIKNITGQEIKVIELFQSDKNNDRMKCPLAFYSFLEGCRLLNKEPSQVSFSEYKKWFNNPPDSTNMPQLIYYPSTFDENKYYLIKPESDIQLFRFYTDEYQLRPNMTNFERENLLMRYRYHLAVSPETINPSKTGTFWFVKPPDGFNFNEIENIRNGLAILKSFRNEMSMIATITVPKDTYIFVGPASEQNDGIERLEGGDIQAFIPYHVVKNLIESENQSSLELKNEWLEKAREESKKFMQEYINWKSK